MYRSDLSRWNACEMGPRRDMLGELGAAVEARGIVLGASSHRVEHWFFMSHGREFDSDIREPMARGDFYWPAMPEAALHDRFSHPAPTDEFLTDWLLRCCELVDRYRPKLIYFDWWIQHQAVKPYLRRFAAYYYNRAENGGRT
jgi:alpha-L-fucosidase